MAGLACVACFTDIFVWWQNKVESKMDEAADHCPVEFGDAEKASFEERRLFPEAVLNAANLLHARNCELV